MCYLYLLAQLDVDLIPETDIPIPCLGYVLGHAVDGHSDLGLPVGHVDLDQLEHAHRLLLLLFLIHEGQRLAANNEMLRSVFFQKILSIGIFLLLISCRQIQVDPPMLSVIQLNGVKKTFDSIGEV